MDAFTPATRSWFEASFEGPTPVQERGWERIAGGEHALLVAPTGSGKTLAAFLWGIDSLRRLEREAEAGVRVLYVSPLKALVYDVERNLRAPLVGIEQRAASSSDGVGEGESARPVRVDVRTGDTPAKERQRQAKDPGEILVTTPESLFLILGSRQGQTLRTVHTVIVDEIHALAPSKRGVHLALSLERLSEIAERDPQRIGLSATVRPMDEVARFLGGDRSVSVVDASEPPKVDLSVRVTVPDMEHVPPPEPVAKELEDEEDGKALLGELYVHQTESPQSERGIWPAIYPELLTAIQSHRSTIVFVNNRGLCERLSQRLNALAGEELVLAHHGSVSHSQRAAIEDRLKEGKLRGIVATSSLELGIDMGAVDQVLLLESPGSVARGLQRVGRAGHQVGAASRGVIFPKFRGDLLECAVVAGGMREGSIEGVRVPQNCLDVLAQQIVAMCLDGERTVESLGKAVRRASPYRELAPEALEAVLDMLSGRYPSHAFADLRPRLRWDRARDLLSARPGASMVSRMNAGTIPDRGNFPVHLGEGGPRVGELDEEMVYETRDGDVILLGASSWRVEGITKDRVLVSPAPGEPGRLPFWKGDGPGRPIELGRALGAFTRELLERGREEAEAWLFEHTPLDEHASKNLADYVFEQREHAGAVPTDRAIVVERFRDELGDWRVCLLTPFGSRVHAPWAMALERRLSNEFGIEVELTWSDDGIVLRLADAEELPELEDLLPDPEDVRELVTEQLGSTALFASLFRENAVRSLLVTRKRPDQRSPLWAQRIKARSLLATAKNYASFPVVLETYRHALSDVFDLAGLEEILRGIQSRSIEARLVDTRSASPFARSLVFAYVANYLYDGDSPAPERRAQALTLDRGLLTELLGEVELRELLDGEVIERLESELAGTAEDRRARDRDELHDLLRRVGDLSVEEMRGRTEGSVDPTPWLAELETERRAFGVGIAGEERWIAAEDAALYRDALGCVVPGGLPNAFLQASEDPWADLLRRFAAGRGPFPTGLVAGRFGLLPAQVEPYLRALEQAGVLQRGEFRPGGSKLEWVDAEVLRRIKRWTLARLRDEVAAVDAERFADFLPRWHAIGERSSDAPGRVAERLLEVVAQLEGLALPWGELAGTLLPGRVPGFTPEALDLLAAEGRVVWIGRGASGPRDGRVALYRREHVAELAEPPAEGEASDEEETDATTRRLEAAILEHLTQRGACFLTELERAVTRAHADTTRAEFEGALWRLVWRGLVTNDTFQPLRSLGRSPSRGARGRRSKVLSGGRWSLVSALGVGEVPATERLLAQARSLFERYGIVGREVVLAEGHPGGFAAFYPVLKALEEAGRVRRGYFVEGLSGVQFAHLGALDALRARRSAKRQEERVVRVLSAVDPASPWGSLLSWPERGGSGSPRRVAGARLISVDGRPHLYVPPTGRALLSFPPESGPRGKDAQRLAFEALASLRRPSGGRSLSIERIDGQPVAESGLVERLAGAGFVRDYRGWVVDPERAAETRSSGVPRRA